MDTCCNRPTNNWSYFRKPFTRKPVPHFYCSKCGTTYHEGRPYSAEEWFFFVNELVFNKG